MSRADRLAIALRRIPNILRAHGAAPLRTLEQKISDAGPTPQRVDPHLLTEARKQLVAAGEVLSTDRRNLAYYHLPPTNPTTLHARIEEIGAVHDLTISRDFTLRLGQALEIAIYRALSTQTALTFLGGFPDLAQHDDDSRYSKAEPPTAVNGRHSPGVLDFLLFHPQAGPVALEAKNIREWIYPNRKEVIALLAKACAIDAVPVLVARRIAYGTYSVLHTAGVLVHQMFNQLYPAADSQLATRARDKRLLGYHDIRLGNTPDPRLLKFISRDLPSILPAARLRFDRYKDLLAEFGSGMDYKEFAGRLRRRERGEPEDGPVHWFENEDDDVVD